LKLLKGAVGIVNSDITKKEVNNMIIDERALLGSTYVTTVTTDWIDILHKEGFSAHFIYDNTTPAAGAFTANVTDICTKASHGFTTGLKVQVSSDDTLPGGLVGSTDYYVIVGNANTFSLTDTLAHALAGTDIINITNAGTGTHTITPTALTAAVAKLQYSNDGTNPDDIASQTVTITADGNKMFNVSGVFYRYVRATFTLTAGQVNLSCKFIAKGE
jgi:hypothetical protein